MDNLVVRLRTMQQLGSCHPETVNSFNSQLRKKPFNQSGPGAAPRSQRVEGNQLGKCAVVSSSNLIGGEALMFTGNYRGNVLASKISP